MRVQAMYTIKDVANKMKVDVETVERWIRNGDLRMTSTYRHISGVNITEPYIVESDLLRFMDTHRAYMGDVQKARVIKVETTFYLPDEFGDEDLDRILAKYERFVEDDLF